MAVACDVCIAGRTILFCFHSAYVAGDYYCAASRGCKVLRCVSVHMSVFNPVNTVSSITEKLFQKFPASLGNFGYKLNSLQQLKGNSFT